MTLIKKFVLVFFIGLILSTFGTNSNASIPTASVATKLTTLRATSNDEFYPTFVSSVNSSAAAETFYTPTTGLAFNPSTKTLTIDNITASQIETNSHITASGNISASGIITASSAQFNDTYGIETDKIRRSSDSSNTTKILLNDEVIKFNTGNSSVETLKLQESSSTFVGHITASGNISGTIRGKQLQVITANFKDNCGTTEHYIPLVGPPDEQTSGVKEQNAMIMPCSGKIKEVHLRMHWTSNTGTAHVLPVEDITWRIYGRDALKRMNGVDLLSSFTVTNPTQGSSSSRDSRVILGTPPCGYAAAPRSPRPPRRPRGTKPTRARRP